MNLIEIFIAACKNLAVNKLRSGLTMLGVIIGVAAVISMVSIVEGGKKKIIEAIEKLGTNLLFVSPKELTEEEQRQYAGRSKGFKYSDALVLKERVPLLKEVAPMVSIQAKLKYGEKDFEGTVTGTLPSYEEVRNFHAEKGRFINQEDADQWQRVVILGQDVARKLFGNEDEALNQSIKIAEERFIVVGIMEKKGSLHGQNYDEMVFIPATTALRRFKGNDQISYLLVQVKERDQMHESRELIRKILMDRHEGVEDFKINSQEDFLRAVDRTIWTFRIMLGGIAAVSLLVGGIGIMNIMLVTVTERTSEIGIRKAVGAKNGDILKQFLIEAVTISLMGGLIGIVIGIFMGFGFGKAVAHAMPGNPDWGAVISLQSILIAFLFSIVVGVFFGLYPAHKASRLDPAEALRYQ
jgi:putative ABC transport system permease protein